MSEKVKISACYIVKNESDNLKRSLESLRGQVDEIILVDTGSVDDTVTVAKKFGAEIFYETWQDDFSAPRNVALGQATGDWIIFLDADEYFTADTSKNIRAVIEKISSLEVNGLLINLVNVDVNDGNKILDASFVLRIFKNLRGIGYVGKIHEELRVHGKNLTGIIPLPKDFLSLIHTGYSTAFNRSKAERNLNLLLAELAETDEPQRIYGYIAQCYNGLDDYINAEKFAKLDIEAGVKHSTFESSSYRILLDILARENRLDERKFFAERATKDFPALPDFYAELAECYAAQNDFENAALMMSVALDKFKVYDGVETSIFNEELEEIAAHKINFWLTKFAESLK